MPYGFSAMIFINMVVQRTCAAVCLLLTEKAADLIECGSAVGRSCNHFHPVASGKNHAFVNRRIGTQACQSVAQIGILEGDAFAHLDGRATVVKTDDDDFSWHSLSKVNHAARSVEPLNAKGASIPFVQGRVNTSPAKSLIETGPHGGRGTRYRPTGSNRGRRKIRPSSKAPLFCRANLP